MSIRVVEWVLVHSLVEARGDLLVLIVLATHAHDDGSSAFPSVATIAAKARLTRRGTQLALRNLEAVGAVERTEQPGQSTTYRIVMDGGEVSSHAKPIRSEVTSREGRSQRQGGAKGSSPEPLKEPSGKNRQGEAHSVRPTSEALFPVRASNGSRKRHEQDVSAWAAEHFPAIAAHEVVTAAHRLSKVNAGAPVDADAVGTELTRKGVL